MLNFHDKYNQKVVLTKIWALMFEYINANGWLNHGAEIMPFSLLHVVNIAKLENKCLVTNVLSKLKSSKTGLRRGQGSNQECEEENAFCTTI